MTLKDMDQNKVVGTTWDGKRLTIKEIRENPSLIYDVPPTETNRKYAILAEKESFERYNQWGWVWQLRLAKIKNINSLSFDRKEEVLKNNPEAIIFLHVPTDKQSEYEYEKLCEVAAAYDKNGRVARLINGLPECLKKLSVESSNGKAIENIINPSEMLQSTAVSRNSKMIGRIIHPCLGAQLIAVAFEPRNLALIDEPSLYAIDEAERQIDMISNNCNSYYQGQKFAEKYHSILVNARLRHQVFVERIMRESIKCDQNGSLTLESAELIKNLGPSLFALYGEETTKEMLDGVDNLISPFKVLEDIALRQENARLIPYTDMITTDPSREGIPTAKIKHIGKVGRRIGGIKGNARQGGDNYGKRAH